MHTSSHFAKNEKVGKNKKLEKPLKIKINQI